MFMSRLKRIAAFVQVIHVLNSKSVQQAIDVSPYVDAINFGQW